VDNEWLPFPKYIAQSTLSLLADETHVSTAKTFGMVVYSKYIAPVFAAAVQIGIRPDTMTAIADLESLAYPGFDAAACGFSPDSEFIGVVLQDQTTLDYVMRIRKLHTISAYPDMPFNVRGTLAGDHLIRYVSFRNNDQEGGTNELLAFVAMVQQASVKLWVFQFLPSGTDGSWVLRAAPTVTPPLDSFRLLTLSSVWYGVVDIIAIDDSTGIVKGTWADLDGIHDTNQWSTDNLLLKEPPAGHVMQLSLCNNNYTGIVMQQGAGRYPVFSYYDVRDTSNTMGDTGTLFSAYPHSNLNLGYMLATDELLEGIFAVLYLGDDLTGTHGILFVFDASDSDTMLAAMDKPLMIQDLGANFVEGNIKAVYARNIGGMDIFGCCRGTNGQNSLRFHYHVAVA